MLFYVLFAIAVGFAFGADVFDVIESEKAYAKGYIESFDWLVGLKPTAIALYLRDGMLIAFASAPALVFFLLHNVPLAYGALPVRLLPAPGTFRAVSARKNLYETGSRAAYWIYPRPHRPGALLQLHPFRKSPI